MLAGVKSQMTGWLSGGIPGLGRGAAAPGEGDAPLPGEINDNEVARNPAQGATTDNVKDDDASRWVAGYVRSILHATIHSSIVNSFALMNLHTRHHDTMFHFSATGGADSGPASLEGTPTEDKDGQQPFGAGEFPRVY